MPVIQAAIDIGPGRAMRVIVGRAIGDGLAHPAVVVQVTGQVLPVVLRVVLPSTIIVLLGIPVEIFGLAIAKAHARQLVGRAILVDGGGDGREQVFARTVLRGQTFGIIAAAERRILIAKAVFVSGIAAAGVGADVASHAVERERTHHRWRWDTAIS